MPRPQVLNWPFWFVVVGAFVGLLGVFTVPLSHSPDEAAHFRRVSAMLHGAIIAPPLNRQSSAYVVDGCVESFVQQSTLRFIALIDGRPSDLSMSRRWKKHTTNPSCLPDRHLVGGGSISNTEVYSPLPYLPALIGYSIGRPLGGALGALYGARLAQLAAYLALGWLALRLIPWGKPYLAAIALLPTSLGNAAGIGVDTVTLGLAIVFFAAILAIIDRSERDDTYQVSLKTLLSLSALAVAIGLTKVAVIPLIALVVLIPRKVFTNSRHRATWLGTTAIATVLTGGLFTLLVATQVHIRTAPGVDSTVVAQWLQSHPFAAPRAFVGALAYPPAARFIAGSLTTSIGLDVTSTPIVLTLVGFGLLFAARFIDPTPRWFNRLRPKPGREYVVAASPNRRRVEGLTAAGIALCALMIIVVGIYQTSNLPGTTVIKGIQGRYFLPLLPLALFGVRRHASALSLRVQQGLLVGLVAFNLIWLVIVLRWWQLLG